MVCVLDIWIQHNCYFAYAKLIPNFQLLWKTNFLHIFLKLLRERFRTFITSAFNKSRKEILYTRRIRKKCFCVSLAFLSSSPEIITSSYRLISSERKTSQINFHAGKWKMIWYFFYHASTFPRGTAHPFSITFRSIFITLHLMGLLLFLARFHLKQMCSHLLDWELSWSLASSICLNYGQLKHRKESA